ncbi:MAG: hypothetical protein GEU91_14045 [Rhizobiales bacterium]|nr:hypothetical protein [Hyphomicrobiales bacterium]
MTSTPVVFAALTEREARLLRLSADNVVAALSLGPTSVTISLSRPGPVYALTVAGLGGVCSAACFDAGARMLASHVFDGVAEFSAFIERAASAGRFVLPVGAAA